MNPRRNHTCSSRIGLLLVAAAALLAGCDDGTAPPEAYEPPPAKAPAPAAGDGVFATVDECVRAATAAFLDLGAGTLERRTRIVAAVRQAMLREGDRLANGTYLYRVEIQSTAGPVHSDSTVSAVEPQVVRRYRPETAGVISNQIEPYRPDSGSSSRSAHGTSGSDACSPRRARSGSSPSAGRSSPASPTRRSAS